MVDPLLQCVLFMLDLVVYGGSAAPDVLGVGQPSEHGGHGRPHDQLHLPDAVVAGAVRVHRHQARDVARSGRSLSGLPVSVLSFLSFFFFFPQGARCSSVVRAFAHGVMGQRIDPSWGGPIELFLVPASAPRLV